MVLIVFYFFKVLKAFNVAKTVTPTSANTASHIFAIPKNTNNSTSILTPIANVIFSFEILIVFLAVFIASHIFDG